VDTVVGEIHVNRTSERHVRHRGDVYVTIDRAKNISSWCKQKVDLFSQSQEELDIYFDLRLNGSTGS